MIDGGDRIQEGAARARRAPAAGAGPRRPAPRERPAAEPVPAAAGTVARPAWEGPSAALVHRHLLRIQGLTAPESTLILHTAHALPKASTRPIKKAPTLRGK